MGDGMSSLASTKNIHYLVDHALFGLGYNTTAGIGVKIGTTAATGGGTSIPTPSQLADNHQFVFVTGDDTFQGAIDTSGRVWTWGTGQKEALGRPVPSSDDKRVAARVTSQPERMIKIGFTQTAMIALGESGKLYGIGKNNEDVFGLGEFYQGEVFTSFVHIAKNLRFKTFDSSQHNVYGIDDEGRLWGWGCRETYSLGKDSPKTKYNDVPAPLLLSEEYRFSTVKATLHGAAALTEGGRVAAIGNNSKGYTNDKMTGYWDKLVVSEDPNRVFIDIFLQDGTLFGIKQDRTLWVCGRDTKNVEGLNNVSRAGVIKQLGDKRWHQLSPRHSGMYGLTMDGVLWTWGASAYSLNFQKETGTTYLYAPEKVNITGVTKLKGNTEALEVDEFEYHYERQIIEIFSKYEAFKISTTASLSDNLIETRFLFTDFIDSQRHYLYSNGGFVMKQYSVKDAFDNGHTVGFLNENGEQIMKAVRARPDKRFNIVAVSKYRNKANDHFIKQARHQINQVHPDDGQLYTQHIFFPGHSKNLVLEQTVEGQV